MAHESFENPDTAKLMNAYFVNVKVDREERPDVDAIYMSVVQMLTGQGGWPMTVFLTPDGKPFYGGTYFPPQDMYGRPGFPRLLTALAEMWATRQSDIAEQSNALMEELEYEAKRFTNSDPQALTTSILDTAYNRLAQRYDATYGGFGAAPKFPQPDVLLYLLKTYARTKQPETLAMLEKTLHNMALGGMYDQLGGGFHRYSTDATWLVPHFEKMLYDNAQLVQAYARTYQVTGKAFYRGVAEETLEYILREMTDAEGGFYSAQDADSEGVEGKFFVWSLSEIQEILGEADAALFAAFYDVTPHGNWEETNILHVIRDAQTVARDFGLSLEETAERLDGSRVTLWQAREKRIKPGLDDKVITAWNGLMLAGLAECAAIFERTDFLEIAVRNAAFVLSQMTYRDSENNLRLYRTWRNGQAKGNGFLEDYACYAEGLLWLYEATADPQWLDASDALLKTMLALFWDESEGGFFFTSSDHESLIQRPKDWDDNAVPSGNSVAMDLLTRMALLRGEPAYQEKTLRLLKILAPNLQKYPYGFARVLSVLEFCLATPKEVALIGTPQAPATQALRRILYSTYLPNRVFAFATGEQEPSLSLPLLEQRGLRDGKPTAYVCSNFICKEPTTDPATLRAQLTQ
jgi:uncharacterized protein YyaL (SSP411 family)